MLPCKSLNTHEDEGALKNVEESLNIKTIIFSGFLQQGTDTLMIETQCNLLFLFVE
jgi:hypothetical protein